MKKNILLYILLGTLILCFTGCGSKKTNSNINNNTVGLSAEKNKTENVNLTVWAEEAAFDTINAMIESFKKAHSGEAVFNINIEENFDSKTKDVLLENVHNGVDVFPLPDDQLSAMVAGGVLDAIPNADAIAAANTPESVAAASIDGTMYAYPMTADNGFFLYYDKKYFSDEDVKTLDRILEVCRDNKKEFSMEFNSGWYMYAFFGNTGLEMDLNDDGVTNYCNWNASDTPIKGTDICTSLLKITADSAFVNRSDGEFPEAIKSGKAIAGISGVWNSVAVEEAWGSDYGACKLPTYTVAGQQVQMSSFTGFKMMGVNYYSDQREWAYKLAEWFTNEQNQILAFEKRNQGPSNIKAAASDAILQVPAIKAVIEQSEYGKLQRVGNKFWEACTNYANIILAGNPEHTAQQELMDKLAADVSASVVD